MNNLPRTRIRLLVWLFSAANALISFKFFRLTLDILLAERSIDNPYWLIALVAAANSIGIYRQFTIAAMLLSASLVTFSVATILLMLIAPLAWGELNMPFVQHVLLTAVIIAIVELASMVTVFATRNRNI